ncbi:hypothetical protein AMECASPLE_038942 [Ameca splendens]|uniref:Uncharacterized protein n=1 Tax=Ameca splendens TaxID=208324 RepID=A0ABV0Z672_9TELE
MAVRRLEEEKRILVREMDHLWKSLLAYEDTLKKLSYLFSSGSFKSSSCPLTDEGLKGLQSIILREQKQVKQVKLQARERYLHALSGAENVNFDPASDDEFNSDSECSDDGL